MIVTLENLCPNLHELMAYLEKRWKFKVEAAYNDSVNGRNRLLERRLFVNGKLAAVYLPTNVLVISGGRKLDINAIGESKEECELLLVHANLSPTTGLRKLRWTYFVQMSAILNAGFKAHNWLIPLDKPRKELRFDWRPWLEDGGVKRCFGKQWVSKK